MGCMVIACLRACCRIDTRGVLERLLWVCETVRKTLLS